MQYIKDLRRSKKFLKKKKPPDNFTVENVEDRFYASSKNIRFYL